MRGERLQLVSAASAPYAMSAARFPGGAYTSTPMVSAACGASTSTAPPSPAPSRLEDDTEVSGIREVSSNSKGWSPRSCTGPGR